MGLITIWSQNGIYLVLSLMHDGPVLILREPHSKVVTPYCFSRFTLVVICSAVGLHRVVCIKNKLMTQVQVFFGSDHNTIIYIGSKYTSQ